MAPVYKAECRGMLQTTLTYLKISLSLVGLYSKDIFFGWYKMHSNLTFTELKSCKLFCASSISKFSIFIYKWAKN